MREDTTEPFEIDEKTAFIFDAKSTGTPFIVNLLDIDTGDEELLINSPNDSFDGRAITPITPGKYVFNITYGKDYNIEPVGVGESDVLELPIEQDGTDFAVLPIELDGAVRFSISNDTTNCIVTLHNALGEKADLVVNDPNPGERATTLMEEGFGFLFIQTLGDWHVEIESL